MYASLCFCLPIKSFISVVCRLQASMPLRKMTWLYIVRTTKIYSQSKLNILIFKLRYPGKEGYDGKSIEITFRRFLLICNQNFCQLLPWFFSIRDEFSLEKVFKVIRFLLLFLQVRSRMRSAFLLTCKLICKDFYLSHENK